jgi:trehalose 6-phosphate phosphatase
VSAAASLLGELVTPLRDDPARSAVLLDVDGTLAPIVRHANDAAVPEPTRTRLIALAKRYGLVACITGRRATDARRIVSLGSITYVGNHGSEILRGGSTAVEVDPEVQAWEARVRAFARTVPVRDMDRLRIRLEDKGPIAAFHWRGAPDETTAHAAVEEIATRAGAEGFETHWGRKVLELRPPVPLDKGRGVRSLLETSPVTSALYAGDDATDLDAFAALRDLVSTGALERAITVGVRSDEGPAAIADEADIVVDGPAGVRTLLDELLQG